MTGPEHYREAERVLDHAEEHAHENSSEWYANAVGNAQVHATLALTAATAYELVHWGELRKPPAEWVEALGKEAR